jgi:hypothetical protein
MGFVVRQCMRGCTDQQQQGVCETLDLLAHRHATLCLPAVSILATNHLLRLACRMLTVF